MKNKHRWLLVALVAFAGVLWGGGNQTAAASGKIVKVTEPGLVKPVHLKVNYLYGTRYGTIYHGTWSEQKLYGLTGKMKLGKYSKRVFYIYRQATVKRGNKKLIYDYVTDKDKMVGGWVHRSKTKAVKNVGYTKEIKKIYNLIKNNATAWSFKQAKLVLGDTNPSYPYSDKRYSYNPGGGMDVLAYIGDSHLGDLVPKLGRGMQKNHNGQLAEPPFDTAAALKDGHTLLLLYRYYQGRGTYFESFSAKQFEEEVNQPNLLNSKAGEDINMTAYSFMMDLQTHINQLDSEYN